MDFGMVPEGQPFSTMHGTPTMPMMGHQLMGLLPMSAIPTIMVPVVQPMPLEANFPVVWPSQPWFFPYTGQAMQVFAPEMGSTETELQVDESLRSDSVRKNRGKRSKRLGIEVIKPQGAVLHRASEHDSGRFVQQQLPEECPGTPHRRPPEECPETPPGEPASLADVATLQLEIASQRPENTPQGKEDRMQDTFDEATGPGELVTDLGRKSNVSTLSAQLKALLDAGPPKQVAPSPPPPGIVAVPRQGVPRGEGGNESHERTAAPAVMLAPRRGWGDRSGTPQLYTYSTVVQLTAMGFDEPTVLAALQRSCWDVNVALDLLTPAT